MRARIDDRDRAGYAASKQLDEVALGLVAKGRQPDRLRKKPGEVAMVMIEIEAYPLDAVLFEPACESAQGRALPNVSASLYGYDKPVEDGGFHRLYARSCASFPSDRRQPTIGRLRPPVPRARISSKKWTIGRISESANSHAAGDHSCQTSA
jgi:hypothetical protein